MATWRVGAPSPPRAPPGIGAHELCRWNSVVSAGQCTFGHTPGDLNFAFVGTWTILLSGPGLNGQEWLSIPNVAIAQGHAGTSNNWWFGGQTCVRKDGDVVRCAATRQNGETWHLTFLRGGNQAYNAVNVVNVVLVEPN